MTIEWSGIFGVLVTPFHADGSIDLDGLDAQVDLIAGSGGRGVVGPVMASEFYTLSDAERATVYERVARRLEGRLPFVAGVSGTSVQHAAGLARHAANAGATAVIAMPPYVRSGPMTRAQVFEYYRGVAAATTLPLIVQNAPAPVGSPLGTDDLVALTAELPQVVAVKEETPPNPHKVGQLTRRLDGRAAVFGGFGGIYYMNELARGASGTMPACQFTDVMVQLHAAHEHGDAAAARRVFAAIRDALVMERLYGVPFMKECLRRRGVIRDTTTRNQDPPLDEVDLAELDHAWAQLEPYFRYTARP